MDPLRPVIKAEEDRIKVEDRNINDEKEKEMGTEAHDIKYHDTKYHNTRYYDTRYYDTRYYDTRYYDTRYYDIGLNLFCRQFPDPEKIIQGAREKGICCILTGTDPQENKRIDAFVRDHDAYGTAGIHPHNADRASQEDIAEIERIITSNSRVVAVGECGLDYDRMFSTRENQIRCLEKHIVLAEKLDRPLFLHERSAADDLVKRFKKHPMICKKSVVHCFTGNKETLEKYLAMGFSIGITGWICDDRRAKELREAVRLIPLDRILIETDAPYLTPKNVPGLSRTNVPENLIYVVRELAKYMKVSEEELVEHARKNTERIFQIKAS